MPPNRLQINSFKVICVRTDGAHCPADCVTCEVAALIPSSIAEKLEGFKAINMEALRTIAAQLEEDKKRSQDIIREKREAIAAARKQAEELTRVREKISVKEGEVYEMKATCEELKKEMVATREARVVLVKERERVASRNMPWED